MIINAALLAAALALPGAVSAQGQTPPANPPASADVQKDRQQIQQTRQEIRKDRQEVSKDAKAIQDFNAQRADALKDLAAKEKAEIDAAKADASLSAEQKKAKVKGIRKSYSDQRREVGRKFHEEKHQLKADVRKQRQEIREERKQLKEERHELGHDAHQKH
ncbi:MAG: hypothetical protein NTY77_12030 [Elusimicrobia bacterium]|nr:hypothetical protein [Elusimicrobiota bacterium]